jgi:hypothetical protein
MRERCIKVILKRDDIRENDTTFYNFDLIQQLDPQEGCNYDNLELSFLSGILSPRRSGGDMLVFSTLGALL